MKKKACYVLMISEQFPSNHPRKGEDTDFYCLITRQIKKHTIRDNYKLWKKRFDKIDKGEAYLSVRIWTGKPYRSLHHEICKLDRNDGIGIQPLNAFVLSCCIDNVYEGIDSKRLTQLANNDGLNRDDFINWFKKYQDPTKVDIDETLALIHFTDFRYYPDRI